MNSVNEEAAQEERGEEGGSGSSRRHLRLGEPRANLEPRARAGLEPRVEGKSLKDEIRGLLV